MGYGVGMLICGNAESHLVFASAIVTAALFRWNDEKAVGGYNASVSMLSGEIVRMDFCGCGSRQQMSILI